MSTQMDDKLSLYSLIWKPINCEIWKKH